MDKPNPAVATDSVLRVAFPTSKPRWVLDVWLYFAAVLVAFGLLLAITALPGNAADLFPSPSVLDWPCVIGGN